LPAAATVSSPGPVTAPFILTDIEAGHREQSAEESLDQGQAHPRESRTCGGATIKSQVTRSTRECRGTVFIGPGEESAAGKLKQAPGEAVEKAGGVWKR
jgi:hypothetical protein